MADISALLANAAQTNADFNFGKLNQAYYTAQDEAQKNALRDVFKAGIPMKDGQPDFGTMAQKVFELGDITQGTALSNLDIARQGLAAGTEISKGIRGLEGGSASTPLTGPPSMNRTASEAVAPDLTQGRTGAGAGGAQPGPGRNTVMSIAAAQGIPNDQLGAASASIARQLGVGPTDPIDVNDPQVRNVLVPALTQFKRMGLGNAYGPGEAVPSAQAVPPIGPQVAQAGPQPPQGPIQPTPVQTAPVQPTAPNPQVDQRTFGAPSALPTRTAPPVGMDPEIQRQIGIYAQMASDPRLPKATQELAKTRLEALQKQNEMTGPLKEYSYAVRQGSTKLSFQDWLAENEANKTAATEEAKLGAAKYQSIVENGTKAQMEIPQLELLQEQMKDPNFFSGAGEKYNLLYKRLKSAVGIDPEAAVPQEYLRKATAANVLSSLGALKGLGQIRVAEINMAREAAASPDNSVPANQLLVEISKRTHQRNAEIADLAQNYKETNGRLDPGFDKQVTAYYKKNPLFTDNEVKNWHNIIGATPRGAAAPGLPPGAPAGARPAPDGRGFMIPNPDPRADKTKNPYVRWIP
jgi:hypothetical protein